MQAVQADVAVIGTGSAGYCAAIEAARSGCSVLVLDKGLAGRSGCSVSAEQIAAVIPGVAAGDSPEVHYRDTLAAGQGLNDTRLARIMVEEGEACIARLAEMGVLFKRTPAGDYALDPMNGHSFPRSLYFRDITGKVMIDTLRGEAQRLGVRTLEDVQITALAGDGTTVSAAIGLDFQRGDTLVARARAIVIATGGASQLYPLTTNPVQSTGDGLCLALKCGAVLKDLEFYQSYPISVVSPETLRGFVLGISQFGRLYNARGERFMEKYSPALLEAATRDVLSQAVASEIRAGNGGPGGGVYLDVTGLNDQIYEEYSDAVRLTRKHGIDLRADRVEVRPAAHYAMGGIKIDERTETGVAGLFAAGEATGGIHGANRLGNNSLLDTVVFGMRAGRFAAEYARQCAEPRVSMDAIQEETGRLQALLKTTNRRYAPWEIRSRLQNVMEQKAGIIRNAGELEAAQSELQALDDQLRHETGVSVSCGQFNRSLADYLETENLLLLARALVSAALERRESRGAHFREDYPRIGGDECRRNYEFVLKRGRLVMSQAAPREGI
jgi:fumarate reductase (CoM/CoB) subunit A